MATACLPAAIAAPLAGLKDRDKDGTRRRMPLSRELRSQDGGFAGAAPLGDITQLAETVMRRRVPAMEIVFSGGTAPGTHCHAVNVLGAPPTLKPLPFAWPTETSALCLHCSEGIVGQPLPAVVGRLKTGQYVPAHALFCSASCALAWLEDDYVGAEKQSAIAWTRDVLARYFGCAEPMTRAPPRIALAKYSHVGEGMTAAVFHGAPDAAGTTHSVTQLFQPPFVTFAAIMECRPFCGGKDAAGGAGAGAGGAAEITTPEGGSSVIAFASSMGQVRGLRRPTKRDTPVAVQQPTGKPPAILEFLAAKARELVAAKAAVVVGELGAMGDLATGAGAAAAAAGVVVAVGAGDGGGGSVGAGAAGGTAIDSLPVSASSAPMADAAANPNPRTAEPTIGQKRKRPAAGKEGEAGPPPPAKRSLTAFFDKPTRNKAKPNDAKDAADKDTKSTDDDAAAIVAAAEPTPAPTTTPTTTAPPLGGEAREKEKGGPRGNKKRRGADKDEEVAMVAQPQQQEKRPAIMGALAKFLMN